jgi:E3 ubiquitin-protein ligase HUWE1
LHAACVWEEILLEKNIPATWDQATKAQAASSDKSNEGTELPTAEGSTAESAPEGSASRGPELQGAVQQSNDTTTKVPEGGAAFKNVQALRYLLSSLPSSITGFFHNLGLGLIGKRRVDSYQRQNATLVADAVAGAVLNQLQFTPPNSSDNPKHRFAYLIVILSSFSHLLYEGKLL